MAAPCSRTPASSLSKTACRNDATQASGRGDARINTAARAYGLKNRASPAAKRIEDGSF